MCSHVKRIKHYELTLIKLQCNIVKDDDFAVLEYTGKHFAFYLSTFIL